MARKRHCKKSRKKSSYASYANTAVKALNTAMYLKGLLNTEFHHYDAKLSSVGQTYNGNIYDICLPAVGDGDTNRTGDSIRLKNFKMQGHISFNNATVNNTQTITLIVFIDKSNTVANADDILQKLEVGTEWAPFAAKDKDKMYQTKILWKRTYTVSSEKDFARVYCNLNNINRHVQFDNGSLTVTSNRLRLLAISDVNTNLPSFKFYSRCSFIDN